MTCEEWLVLFRKGPDNCTAAERGSVMNHTLDCPNCNQILEQNYQDAVHTVKQLLAPDELQAFIAKNTKECEDLAKKDLTDPESGAEEYRRRLNDELP